MAEITATVKTIAERETDLATRLDKFTTGYGTSVMLMKKLLGGYHIVTKFKVSGSDRWDFTEYPERFTLKTTGSLTLDQAENWAIVEAEVRAIALRVVTAVSNQESADFLIWRSGQAAAVLLQTAFPAHPSRELVLRSFKEMEYLAAERGWDFRFDPEGVPFFKTKSKSITSGLTGEDLARVAAVAGV